MLEESVCDLRSTMCELQERLHSVDGEGEWNFRIYLELDPQWRDVTQQRFSSAWIRWFLSAQSLFSVVCSVSCPKCDCSVTVSFVYSDVPGNEWKTRYETQIELKGQLERQMSLIHERLEDLRGNPMGKSTGWCQLLKGFMLEVHLLGFLGICKLKSSFTPDLSMVYFLHTESGVISTHLQ